MPRPFRERPTKGMSAPLLRRERTSAADPRHGRRSGAKYTGTRVKRPVKEIATNIQGFVKDVGNLLLEVLHSHCVVKHKVNEHRTCVMLRVRLTKSIQKLLPVLGFGGNDFTASTTSIRVDVERFLQAINRAETRRGTGIKWCGLILFWFFSFKQRMTCTGTI